jgi:predicted nucleic acid-binding Zn ribbon protein
MNARTYQMAACASGCAYHSTTGGTCPMCGGPLTTPQTVTSEQAREILRGGQRYDAGKARTIAWLKENAR